MLPEWRFLEANIKTKVHVEMKKAKHTFAQTSLQIPKNKYACLQNKQSTVNEVIINIKILQCSIMKSIWTAYNEFIERRN